MQSTATDVTRSEVCVFVCVLITHSAKCTVQKRAEPTDIPFEQQTLVDQRNYA